MPRFRRTPRRAATAIAALTVAGTVAIAGPARAHTDADLVAVPAGHDTTLVLEPTHGCGESPTVRVRIRAPFEGATALPVEGWSASSTPDGQGNTVLDWSGGSLPSDEEGAFPVQFVADATPGTLLVFPAIQLCASGEELAWIDGDPEGEYPAPRLLVLPADHRPAATIDEVAPDAPGRDQLVEILDLDGVSAEPQPPSDAPPTTGAAPPTPSTGPSNGQTTGPSSTVTMAPAATVTPGPGTPAPTGGAPRDDASTGGAGAGNDVRDADDDGSSGVMVVVVVIVLTVVVIAAAVAARAMCKRRRTG